MSALAILAAAVFLPLFPFSIAFNRLFASVTDARLRVALLLICRSLGSCCWR